MFTIPCHIVDQVWKTLPEQLKNSHDWREFKLRNGHLIREYLVYDFGKYEILFSCRYSDEHEDWPNVRFSFGASCFITILHGKTEIALGSLDRKNKKIKTCSVRDLIFLGNGSSLYLSNRSSVVIIPRSPVVYTLSVAVKMPYREKLRLQEEILTPGRTDELVSIFRDYFPTDQTR